MKTINLYYVTPLVAAIAMANASTANAQHGINLGGSAGLSASSSISGSIMGMGASSSLTSGLSASSALSLTGGLGELDSVINSLNHTASASGDASGMVRLEGLGDLNAAGNTDGVVDLVSGFSSSAPAPSLPGLNVESQVSAVADAAATAVAGRPAPENSTSDDSANGEPSAPAESQTPESGNGVVATLRNAIGATGSLTGGGNVPSSVVATAKATLSSTTDATASYGNVPTPESPEASADDAEPETDEATPQESGSGNDLFGSLQSATDVTGSFVGGASAPDALSAAIEGAVSSMFDATASYGNTPIPESPEASADDAEPEADEAAPQESDSGNDLFASLQSATDVTGSFTGGASVPDSVIAALEASGSSASDATVGLSNVSDESNLDIVGSFVTSFEGAANLDGAIEGSQIASLLLMSQFQSAQEMAASIESAGQGVSAAGDTSTDLASNTTASAQ